VRSGNVLTAVVAALSRLHGEEFIDGAMRSRCSALGITNCFVLAYVYWNVIHLLRFVVKQPRRLRYSRLFLVSVNLLRLPSFIWCVPMRCSIGEYRAVRLSWLFG
jgi:hypothetical protein